VQGLARSFSRFGTWGRQRHHGYPRQQIRELTAQPQVESVASGSARRREATWRADGGGEDPYVFFRCN
jgi:hypothetical protein